MIWLVIIVASIFGILLWMAHEIDKNPEVKDFFGDEE